MANYYCHECNRRVTVNNALQCENCRGEFVEEVPEENDDEDIQDGDHQPSRHHQGMFVVRDGENDGRTIIFEGANPFESMLQSDNPFGRLFGQILSQASSSSANRGPSSATSSHRPATPHVDADVDSSTQDAQRSRGERARGGGAGAPQANPMGDGLMHFFNQLMANLAENGGDTPTRLTFHINNGGGGGGGGGGEGGAPIFQTLHGNMGDYAWGEGGIDHIVTQLLNQFEGGREECVRPEDLNRLPMTEVTPAQAENQTQCATCMETFTLNERVAKLDCQHIFHRPCIEPWLKKRNTCPICRQAVEPKNWGPAPKISDVDELD